jgi:hypothetical protein
MKTFSFNKVFSKRSSKATVRNKSSKSGITAASYNLSSGQDLDKVGSLLQKLKEVTNVKEKLALNNQALKFRVAELQKEKYSLSQLNKKLTIEINKTRREEQAVVVLLKKDFNLMLGNYYKMAEELGRLK